jgi:Chondroitinase B/FlgD Ig-like domain
MLRSDIVNYFFLALQVLLAGTVLTVDAFAQSSEVLPGQLSAVATIRCVGLEWKVEGDTNGNATANVKFRETGTDTWQAAMPLFRLVSQTVTTDKPYMIGPLKVTMPGTTDYLQAQWSRNSLAGSVFHLKPGTAYEFQVTLADPDGGVAVRTVSAATRTEPTIPARGNIISVSEEGDALAAAVSAAKAGDIITLKAGTYSGFNISASGTATQPVCIVAETGAEVIIRGGGTSEGNTCIKISGSYVYMQGITIDNCWTGIKISGGADNVAVMRCTIRDARYCIMTRANDGYFADNTIWASYDPDWDVTEGEGVQIDYGSGNVICYNKIRGASDGWSVYTGSANTDCYGNDVMFCGDDAFEYDYGSGTTRVWGNRFSWNGFNSISFQPYACGPAYLVHNLVIHSYDHGYLFKDRYESSHLIAVNNTFISHTGSNLPMCTFSRNNLFINPVGDSDFSIVYHYEDFMYNRPFIAPLDIDYDGLTGRLRGYTWRPGYFTSDYEKSIIAAHGPRTLSQFQADVRQELHGTTITPEIFEKSLPTTWPSTGHNTDFDDQTTPSPDFGLAATSQPIDKGVALPNIIGGYSGSGPDLGGLEYGSAITWGPRPSSGWTYPWFPFYPAVAVGEIEMNAGKALSRLDIIPFPFNGDFVITCLLPEAERTSTITIHDHQGKILKTARPVKISGEKTVAFWNGKDEEGKALGSGIYSIKLTVNDSTYSEQLIQIH